MPLDARSPSAEASEAFEGNHPKKCGLCVCVMPGTTTRSRSASTSANGSGVSGARGARPAATSPGLTRAATGRSGMRSRWSAIQSTSACAATRNSSGVMASPYDPRARAPFPRSRRRGGRTTSSTQGRPARGGGVSSTVQRSPSTWARRRGRAGSAPVSSRCRATSPRVCLAAWLTTVRPACPSCSTRTATVRAARSPDGGHAAAYGPERQSTTSPRSPAADARAASRTGLHKAASAPAPEVGRTSRGGTAGSGRAGARRPTAPR